MSPDSSSTLFENQDQVSDSAVSDFLKRLESLKQKTDSEEKDRAQKLEGEIEEAKRQRLARRLARSRSLSPEKFASSTSSAGIPPSRSTVTVNNESITERKSTPRLSFDNSPVLSPTPAIAGRRSPVSAKESPLAQSISKFSGLDTSSPAQIRLNPAIQPTPVLRGVSPSPFLGRDTSSSRAPSNSPASNLSSPLAPKPTQSVSTMEKIKKWENSAEIDQSATIAGDEPTVVPMPKANDTESRSKKELESSDISVSRLEHIPDLSSSRESESSSSSIATELLMQAESKNNDIVAHPREQSVAVKRATSQECDNAISSLSRRTSGLNLTSTSTAASQSRFDSNIDKDKEAADREEERLSKFLRPSSQRPPQKDRLQLHSNYTPIFPSPSVHHSRSPSPTLTPINEDREARLQTDRSISRSPSHSPERSPNRGIESSPFRSNRYSGIGTFASSDFYNEGSISPASYELGLKNLPGAIGMRRTDSVRSTSSVASTESADLAGSPSVARSSSPARPKSPVRVGFVQSAMLKRDGNQSPSKRLSMINLRPAPAVLNSTGSSPPQKSQELQRAGIEKARKISTTIAHPQDAIVDECATDDKSVPDQSQGEPGQQKVEDEQPSTPLSKTITPIFRTPDGSPTPRRMRKSPSLHRTTSSLTMTRSAVERFRARDLDLTAKYDKERDNSIVSQYSESNFKPSPGHKSLLDMDSEAEDRITVRRPRGIEKRDQVDISKDMEDATCAETEDESNKENLAVDGSSPSADRPKTPTSLSPREWTPNSPLLSRSPSRLPNNKRWPTPTSSKSSWLESALKKTGSASLRAPGAKSPKDLFS